MVWSKKTEHLQTKHSIKNYKFDGNKIVKRELKNNIKPLAVIYCRVSSDKQVREWFWLETQEEIAREWCKKNNIEVEKVFREEWISWKEEHRKAFDECINYIKERNNKFINITHFVCRDLTRISRPDLDNIWVAFEMEAKIKAYWVTIIDIEWNTKDITDEDKLVKAITYAYAWYQRNKIKKLCLTGRRWRLLQWYRPFTFVPYWYKRIRSWWKSSYVDEIDWDVAPILKEWLELFANDPNMGQMELYKFFQEKWLKWFKWGKMWKTYIEKMLQVHRLYFYAWYCIYPDWDINELIEWQHEWIISLDTANKIRDKLQSKNKKRVREKEWDAFILKHMVTCTWCWRKLTWWVTVKQKTGKSYPYYWCQFEWCPERDHIPQDKLENTALEMIKSVKFPKPLLDLFESIIERLWNIKEKDWDKIIISKKHRISQIEERKKKIENLMLKDSINDSLLKKLDDERFELDAEYKDIQNQLENNEVMTIDRNKSLKKIKEFIWNPLSFWEQWDIWLRKQILEVRFWDSLIYSKTNWLQTSDTTILYNVLRDLLEKSTLCYPEWDLNPYGLAATRFWV